MNMMHASLGIGIEETNAGIGIPASRILVRLIVSFFQSGTGLTGYRTVRHSGISIYVSMDIDIGMKR
jgi:hypothetical protein